MSNNTVTEKELSAFEETVNNHYHANHLIATKYLGKKHLTLKKGVKGEAYYLKNGNQWYFRAKGTEDFYRVNWFNLDANVEVGFFGYAIYEGMNPAFNGRKGEAHFTKDFDWVFIVEVGDGKERVRVQPENLKFL